jgi:hypothetical protein
MKMNPEAKRLWLRDLRSGEIKQAHGVLRETDNSMCCLGVLCNVHAQLNPEFAATQLDPLIYDKCHGDLPDSVSRWSGLLYNSGCTAFISELVSMTLRRMYDINHNHWCRWRHQQRG